MFQNLLRDCLKSELDVIENKSIKQDCNTLKKMAWQKVAHRFNQLNAVKRNVGEIRGQWRRLKKKLKNNELDETHPPCHFICGSDPLHMSYDITTVKIETDSEDVTDDENNTVTHERRNGENLHSPLNADVENSICSKSPTVKQHKRDGSLPYLPPAEKRIEKDKVLMQSLQEEHNLKIKHMKEAHSWAREEHNLQKQKLQLEIMLIKQQLGNIN